MPRPKALFIGQAPPFKQVALPFGRTHLYKWLASVGIDQETALSSFAFAALAQKFPGRNGRADVVPSPAILQQDRPILLELIQQLQPPIIVPVGALSIREVLQQPQLALKDAVGRQFIHKPFGLATFPETIIIPLPHPSGASTWQYLGDNKVLLRQALVLLKKAVDDLDTG
ncbi:MAG TPA: uracil-DNA glycosylase family protein [Candidatus Saccharimonadales bacterium]|nr:uracil-DNA glycosylase family protein [Candidatus Saccharimonadales bacterium]